MKEHLFPLALELLQQLISIPSFSKEENKTASLIENFFKHYDIITTRKGNNVWSKNKFFDTNKPTILLNSHHDTVKPNPGYTRDPFDASFEDGKLYGLGSNDAGGPLVSLIMTFFYFIFASIEGGPMGHLQEVQRLKIKSNQLIKSS